MASKKGSRLGRLGRSGGEVFTWGLSDVRVGGARELDSVKVN